MLKANPSCTQLLHLQISVEARTMQQRGQFDHIESGNFLFLRQRHSELAHAINVEPIVRAVIRGKLFLDELLGLLNQCDNVLVSVQR